MKLSFDEEATCKHHRKLLQAIERHDSTRTEALLRKPVNPDHRCPKHPCSAMQAATSCGCLAAVKLLIEAGTDLNGAPLHQACEIATNPLTPELHERCHKIVSALIYGRADNSARDSHGGAPLCWAINMYAFTLLQLLLNVRQIPT